MISKSDCILLFKRKNHFSEQDLSSVILACKERNPQAQRCLIRQFTGYAKSISLRYAANIQEAEELINDGFLKVFVNLEKYDHSQPFKAWLRKIMINTAIDYYRKNQKWHEQVSMEGVEISDCSSDILSEISAQEILTLVQRLPPAYRMAFTLFVIDGFSHKEIADMLGIQEGTSKSNLRDARRKLQAMIKIYYPHLYQLYHWPNRGFNAN
ncbi:DNA-directed RNA polymerase sigma-70 factor [Dyadobacter frigoris]|nr:DNA-directed RNA polymerase sigma-70 factor [Dyadobacter frigoris]